METPPLKPFLFVITFLAIFGLLVALIPSEFLVASEEYREQNIPTEDYFEAMDLEAYAETLLYYMNETGGKMVQGYLYVVKMDIGGHDCSYEYTKANYSNPYIQLRHYYAVWWLFTDCCYMKWTDANGVDRTTKVGITNRLTLADLEASYEDAQPLTAKCKHFQVDVFFDYNETAYSSVEDAWNHHGLMFLLGVEFDQMSTGLNAWNLIGMILFFKMPSIPPPFSYIIGVPIWVCIAWLAFAFIIAVIKALPFT
jgi:hypothetical protein